MWLGKDFTFLYVVCHCQATLLLTVAFTEKVFSKSIPNRIMQFQIGQELEKK